MRFDLITIFPEFFVGPLDHGIVRRAREAGIADVHMHDLRQFAHDRHRTVDDRPFGGGQGMVLMPEPLFEAVESLLKAPAAAVSPSTAIVLLSASGKLFRQETAARWARLARVVLLCGRYEGVDERVAEHLATEEISVGDFVVTGGEIPAALIVDAVTRLLPGALGNEASAVEESFSTPSTAPGDPRPRAEDQRSGIDASPSISLPAGREWGCAQLGSTLRAPISSVGILDCPHYTRPQVFRGWAVPDTLVSGNHEQIRLWRRKMTLAKTLRNRPELLELTRLSEEDRWLMAQLLQRAKASTDAR